MSSYKESNVYYSLDSSRGFEDFSEAVIRQTVDRDTRVDHDVATGAVTL